MKDKRAFLLRGGIIMLAAAFLIVGICMGQHLDVLRKAVTVCLECIGIG